ncbi:MAG: hypothetical protein R3F42_02565 [Pseudomonadota bacterium]
MQLSRFQRPLFYVPAAVLLLLAVTASVLFNPDVQQRLLLEQAGPLVDELEIGHVQLTPWSLSFDHLVVAYRGARVRIAQGELRFCLTSLLRLELDVSKLLLRDVHADLQEFSPPDTAPETAPGIFPGALAVLAHGVSYRLLRADSNIEIVLPANRTVSASITGSGIRPGATGGLYLQASLRTGTGADHIDIDSRIYLAQLHRGRFRDLTSFHTLTAALSALPAPERADIELDVKPAQSTAATEQHPAEAVTLVLRQDDNAGEPRARLALQGDYDGNTGLFAGRYRVAANERLVQPYTGATAVPPAEQTLTGSLDFNLAAVTGELTITSDLLVSELRETANNARLPERLRLENNLRVSLLPDRQLLVETLDSGLTDEDSTRPLAARLPANLQVPLNDIDAFLHREQTLLEFELPVVPLPWFDVLLPEQEIAAGTLTGAFAITTDADATLHLKPLKPVRVQGLEIRQADGRTLRDINLSVLAGASYNKDILQVTLDKLELNTGRDNLARGNAALRLPLSGTAAGSIQARLQTDLAMHHLAALLTGKRIRNQSLPQQLAVNAQTRLLRQHGTMRVEQLDAGITSGKDRKIASLQLKQALLLTDTNGGLQLGNDSGTLATLALSDIPLSWFSSFVPDTTLRGRLYRANFTLAADTPGVVSLKPDGAFRLAGVTVTGRAGALLDAVSVSVLPSMQRTADGTTLDYRNLRVTGGDEILISGDGSLTLPAQDRPLQAAGHLEVNLEALSRQPLLAGRLQAALSAPARLQADYRLAQDSNRIDISRLSAALLYTDAQPRIALQADAGIRIPTVLNTRRSALGGSRGKIAFTVSNLTPEPFADILAANGISITSADGRVVLDTDGRAVSVSTPQTLQIRGLTLTSAGKTRVRPFTFSATTAAVLRGDELRASLNDLAIRFDNDPTTAALQGEAELTLRGGDMGTRAETVRAELALQLPGLLDQPALLPGHTLETGVLDAKLQLDGAGRLSATARVHDLTGGRELPLQTIRWQIDGQLDPDGGFSITAPVTTAGRSGSSTLGITAVHRAQPGDNHDVAISIDSPVFYLNDILNTLQLIAGHHPDQTADSAPAAGDTALTPTAGANVTAPDRHAIWDLTDYDLQVAMRMDRLFYTDYLEFTGIRGQLESLPHRLDLSDFEAHFHDSPIDAHGTLHFNAGELPYDLNLSASVDQFDLARFFRELTPGATPQAEGLFDVRIDAYGQSPNMTQYRNNLLFDARLQSSNGVFRLLDPDSPLVGGSTGLAGGFGEIVSYVPTGLFGIGAVSRLVNYIKEVDYDKVVVELARDTSRDVKIRQYVVQNPEVLMTASGGISYQPGTDVLQSPLSLDAQLSLREKGAAIFYELGLLSSEHDAWGYWLGPQIQFRGTPANPESNLDDIISDAGKGAVLGGIIRPISGLIGNIRHRWLEEKPPRLEYPTDTSP